MVRLAAALEISLDDSLRMLSGGSPHRESRVEYDTPRAPVVGAMEGYAEAEAEARRRFRHIPDHVWEQVRELMGFRIRPPITAELLLDLANVVAKHGEPAPED